MTLTPEREMALHALIDGELDAMAAIELEAHLQGCDDCRAALDRLQAVRRPFASEALYHRAPPGLRRAVAPAVAIDHPARRAVSGRALPWLGGGTIGALAASLALLIAIPQLAEAGVEDELVAAHIRSLQAAHLVDVVTSDRHVVKPWFNGRIDFSPMVIELAPQGFPLVGGRLDYVGRRDIAAIVYARRRHRINLFIRPAPLGSNPLSHSWRHASYGIVRWVSHDLEYWAVSDLDSRELLKFRDAFRRAAEGQP